MPVAMTSNRTLHRPVHHERGGHAIARKALISQPARSSDSTSTAEMPMILLPGRPSSAIIWTSHPSHRSLPRKVTCIKDGYFFCDLPDTPGEVEA